MSDSPPWWEGSSWYWFPATWVWRSTPSSGQWVWCEARWVLDRASGAGQAWTPAAGPRVSTPPSPGTASSASPADRVWTFLGSDAAEVEEVTVRLKRLRVS